MAMALRTEMKFENEKTQLSWRREGEVGAPLTPTISSSRSTMLTPALPRFSFVFKLKFAFVFAHSPAPRLQFVSIKEILSIYCRELVFGSSSSLAVVVGVGGKIFYSISLRVSCAMGVYDSSRSSPRNMH